MLTSLFKCFVACGLFCASTLALAQGPGHKGEYHRGQFPYGEHRLVRLSPNPAETNIFVRLDAPQTRTTNFQIHNIIGNSVNTDAKIIDDFEAILNVKDLSPGIYLLTVYNEHTGTKGVLQVHQEMTAYSLSTTVFI